jgi:hypothetical protein
VVLATQRLGKLRKDAAAELLNVMIGGTMIDIDRKRAADALGIYGNDIHAFYDAIKVLKPGKFFALGPAIGDERQVVEVGAVVTTHPQAGDSKHSAAPPPAPEAIAGLLAKLSDLPKQAEEKAKTEKELRDEIRSLKAQLRSQPVTVKEVRVVDQEAIDRAVTKAIGRLENTLHQIVTAASKSLGESGHDKTPVPASVPVASPHREQSKPPAQTHSGYGRPAPVRGIASDNGKLRSGAERMLAALAQWSPNGMTEGQMRAHAGLKKSGTFSAYLSDLRKGYIEERDGLVFASEQGLEYSQHVAPAPESTEEVLAIWKPKLRDGARRMLEALVAKGGEAISKEDLGELSQLQKSGTFSAYLSDLKTARLAIVSRDGMVAANKETLFL